MAEIPKPQEAERLSQAEEAALFRRLVPLLRFCLPLNHDLNNPLAGIIGYCEFMQEEADDLSFNQIEYLNNILICAERIRKLAEKLSNTKIALSEEIDIKELNRILENYES